MADPHGRPPRVAPGARGVRSPERVGVRLRAADPVGNAGLPPWDH